MNHEKIFKRGDGSKVKIFVSVYVGSFDEVARWNYGQMLCEPGKRKFVCFTDNIDLATQAEILETKLELWNKLMPE
jgi:hypothetical protein